MKLLEMIRFLEEYYTKNGMDYDRVKEIREHVDDAFYLPFEKWEKIVRHSSYKAVSFSYKTYGEYGWEYHSVKAVIPVQIFNYFSSHFGETYYFGNHDEFMVAMQSYKPDCLAISLVTDLEKNGFGMLLEDVVQYINDAGELETCVEVRPIHEFVIDKNNNVHFKLRMMQLDEEIMACAMQHFDPSGRQLKLNNF